MDFKSVLSSLIRQFGEQDIRYGLMGGFALGLWGIGRATVDLDLLVDKRDLGKVDGIMKGLGYAVRFSSENVTQYASPVALFGEVDLLHAFRETSMSMLTRAVDRDVFSGALRVRVLLPEDLIGLKLQAIKNDPSRRSIDLPDIKALAEVRKGLLEWKTIEHYASLLDAQELLAEIRE
jgi:hypothetical protein